MVVVADREPPGSRIQRPRPALPDDRTRRRLRAGSGVGIAIDRGHRRRGERDRRVAGVDGGPEHGAAGGAGCAIRKFGGRPAAGARGRFPVEIRQGGIPRHRPTFRVETPDAHVSDAPAARLVSASHGHLCLCPWAFSA